MLQTLDELSLRRVKVVGHDWGSIVGWLLASKHPQRIESFVALSVGHPRAYVAAGWEQKRKSWYVAAFQLRGLAEWLLRAQDWRRFRLAVQHHPESQRWIADLARPGRLTAGLNWYRANFWRLLRPGVPRVQVPVLGIWSTGDMALAEEQMTSSAAYVDAHWRYERIENIGHWIPLDAPEQLAQLLLEFHSSSG